MKCVHCGCSSNHRARKRENGCCPVCRKPFVFEPQQGDPYTDVAFKAAIDRVSSSGSVRFTPAHVRYELARRPSVRVGRPAWILTVLVVATCAIVGSNGLVFLLLIIPFGIYWLIKLARETTAIRPSGPTIGLSRERFAELWQRWLRVHGEPRGLIVRRTMPAAKRALPDDISEYSFDRAVICDRAETVDLLLANNFHFENNCAVLSEDGYPQQVFATVRAMLKKNPKLAVYVLHDATRAGCELAQRIAREPEWFPGAMVVDVGMRPVHAEGFSGAYEQASGVLGSSRGLTPDEVAWLSNYTLELASVLPEQLIKRLYSAIAKPLDPQAAGLLSAGAYYIDTQAMKRQATASDGGGDSFG